MWLRRYGFENQAGEKIEPPKERTPPKVVHLMDALRQAIEAEGGKLAPAIEPQRHQSALERIPVTFEHALSCAGLTRASVLFRKRMDRRVKPGDDD